ncbi:MAG: hemerythrin domain-containing protein [Bacteroidetes bacterium]|nr:hemerythrin domain-containing protein [Bacteroidota bacterium]
MNYDHLERASNPVRQLLAEHVAFRAACDELLTLIERLQRDGYRAHIQTADYATLLRTREIIREHLNVHLVKEEEIFFPRLEQIVPQGRVKFLFLNYDHEFLRDYFNEFCTIVSDFEEDRVPMHVSVKRIIETGSHIVHNLIQHILTEDTVYFEVAEHGFDDETLEAMGNEMLALERRLKEQEHPHE